MEKFFLLSKTVQGVVLMVLPVVSQLFGFDWSQGDTEGAGKVLESVVQLAGAAWALYGRLTAKTKLSVS